MKKFLVVALALVLSLALAAPVMANGGHESDVTLLGQGQGGPPVVMCKWETPDTGDTGHLTPGTQVDPPLVWQEYEDITYWAVVFDPEGSGNIDAVYVDVNHPDEPPLNGSFKYQEELTSMSSKSATWATTQFETAWNNGLVHVVSDNVGNPLYSYTDIWKKLNQEPGKLYRVISGDPNGLYYEQPAGDYEVIIKAVDKQGLFTELSNDMEYVAVTMVEVDFTTFSFGSLATGSHKLVDGDTTFVTPAEPAGEEPLNGATVRNIGNTLAYVTVYETDLYDEFDTPLGKTGDNWNVQYDARLGAVGTMANFNPFETATLDILGLSTTEKLDFSIQINKAGTTGEWTGEITIGSESAPFGE